MPNIHKYFTSFNVLYIEGDFKLVMESLWVKNLLTDGMGEFVFFLLADFLHESTGLWLTWSYISLVQLFCLNKRLSPLLRPALGMFRFGEANMTNFPQGSADLFCKFTTNSFAGEDGRISLQTFNRIYL